jgi:tetratricopeptide (TPR) repeat protein
VRRRTTFLAGSAIAVALALGSLVGGVLAEPSGVGPAPPALAQQVLAGPGAGGISQGAVARLEELARMQPGHAGLLAQLGLAYQLRWRETADASFLPRSEAALRRALRTRPSEANAVLGLGSLALIRHEFKDALRYGRRAERLLPGSARPYGVIGDAFVELGRYPEAFAAFERMVALRPSLASYARVAYARELTGDQEGAISAMRLALDAAAGQPEPSAWSLVELARLEFAGGRIEAAGRDASAALEALAGYPAARAMLARVEAARGRIERAIAEARRAADAVPTPQAVALLADLLDRAGERAEARRQRATVAVIDRLLQANGVQVDLESAVYRADNRIRPRETVELARRARAARPSIHGDDALAWALARAGRCGEAVPLAIAALRLGTRDPLLYFHRGYAEGCAGDRQEMRDWYRRALALSPDFSVRWALVARAALRGR